MQNWRKIVLNAGIFRWSFMLRVANLVGFPLDLADFNPVQLILYK